MPPSAARATLVAFALFALAPAARAAPSHAMTLGDPPALAKGFAHFPYANPQAPREGTLRLGALGGFSSLNPFSIRGEPASLLALTHATLFLANPDEANVAYGYLAESVEVADDNRLIRFTLRQDARFHDSTPITAQDIVFSFHALRKAHPLYRRYWGDITDAHAESPRVVVFANANPQNREIAFILGQIPALSERAWRKHDLSRSTLAIIPSSGPYRIADAKVGNTLTYERVPNHWSQKVNVARGRHNFQTIRIIYYRDGDVALTAFRAGDLDFRAESVARNWAVGYDFPAAQRGEVLREIIPNKSPQPMQAFLLNHRRAPFDDMRVREALNLAFDFESANATLFYGQYKRTGSYFGGSELAARAGAPSEQERALLAPLMADLPPQTLNATLYANPVGGSPGAVRANLRRARDLLREAGWQLTDGALRQNSRPLTMEILLVQPTMEKIALGWLPNLRKLGIAAKIRLVDSSQYIARLREFDYDIIVGTFRQSLSPGNEQRDYWSAQARATPGSANYLGIANPAIDSLVATIIAAQDRPSLITATRALDRALLWGHHLVPHWHSPGQRVAYWQRIQRPAQPPRYDLDFPAAWWARAP